MDARERALHTIVKLRTLAEHPNTPPHEAESARGKIRTLQDKHGITASDHPPSQSKVFFDDLIRRAAKAKAKSEAERKKKAQADWERKHANSDDLGRPRGDIFDEALRDDPRTTAERNRDMNDSWGQKQPHHRPSQCDPKLSFFDLGGEPRKRNMEGATCVMCGTWLGIGDGALIGVNFACCDKIPGPRKKKERQE